MGLRCHPLNQAEDPVTVGNWLASRNRIGQVHFRNVVMRQPRADYTEVFPDDGDNDMFEVMKLLVKNNYKRLIFPEHPRTVDVDKLLPRGTNPNSALAYRVGHCRAMFADRPSGIARYLTACIGAQDRLAAG